jgi:hypothetical protein
MKFHSVDEAARVVHAWANLARRKSTDDIKPQPIGWLSVLQRVGLLRDEALIAYVDGDRRIAKTLSKEICGVNVKVTYSQGLSLEIEIDFNTS